MFNIPSDPWYNYMKPFRTVLLKKIIHSQQQSEEKQQEAQASQSAQASQTIQVTLENSKISIQINP